ncbi:hypothetical protein ES705_41053 [subsurface metagenome]
MAVNKKSPQESADEEKIQNNEAINRRTRRLELKEKI